MKTEEIVEKVSQIKLDRPASKKIHIRKSYINNKRMIHNLLLYLSMGEFEKNHDSLLIHKEVWRKAEQLRKQLKDKAFEDLANALHGRLQNKYPGKISLNL